jgi:hypothetical protein
MLKLSRVFGEGKIASGISRNRGKKDSPYFMRNCDRMPISFQSSKKYSSLEWI